MLGSRLCVYWSGSLLNDIFRCTTLIRVSCLHFGQKRGKRSRTVSEYTFVLVFPLQIGQRIHSDFSWLAAILVSSSQRTTCRTMTIVWDKRQIDNWCLSLKEFRMYYKSYKWRNYNMYIHYILPRNLEHMPYWWPEQSRI